MATDSYRPDRDISDEFLRTVGDWIRDRGEIFVVLRYLRAAGNKDYAFIRSTAEFNRLVELCSVGTDIIAFRDRQLPLRERASPALIRTASELLPAWKEYLYVVMEPMKSDDPRLFGEMGDTPKCLAEDIGENLGKPVAIGPCPDFISEDNDSMISRAKGGIDGPR